MEIQLRVNPAAIRDCRTGSCIKTRAVGRDNDFDQCRRAKTLNGPFDME